MHIQVSVKANPALQEVLIALLADIGYDGFEQLDQLLKAYIMETEFDETRLKTLAVEYSVERIEERNWNEQWEMSFQPVVVEDFCAIRAHFHEPIPGIPFELVITPKMSFGTGHHATTYLMVQAMQELPLRDKRVLDFGTGTGVLAILAEKLGAAEVQAIDIDDWSIANARENIAANGCMRITVEQRDRVDLPSGGFDIILANINKHVILEQLSAMEQQLKRGGVILLSGLLLEDAEDIENEAAKTNLSISGRMQRTGWILLKSEKMK